MKAKLSTQAVLDDLRRQMQAMREASTLVIQPPSVPGIGTGGGFKMYVEDRAGRGPRALEQAVGGLVARANRTPGLVQVFTLFNTSTPEVYADIDRMTPSWSQREKSIRSRARFRTPSAA